MKDRSIFIDDDSQLWIEHDRYLWIPEITIDGRVKFVAHTRFLNFESLRRDTIFTTKDRPTNFESNSRQLIFTARKRKNII